MTDAQTLREIAEFEAKWEDQTLRRNSVNGNLYLSGFSQVTQQAISARAALAASQEQRRG